MAMNNILVLPNIFDIDGLLAQSQWQPLVEGVRFCEIYSREPAGARAAFLHYLPGAKVPPHKHQGLEHILILQGYQIDGDKTYSVGTLVIHPESTVHSLDSPEGCVALGIWEKPVTFV
jgi:anti-sigma factor ChrR (cupin superfamily)